MDSEEINDILDRISSNDCHKSFRKLFDRYYSTMFEVARHYLQANHLAEEVVGDVFVKLWKNRHSLKAIKNLNDYLFISVKRQSLNMLRKKEKDLLYIDSLDYKLFVEASNPENSIFSQEYLDYISACIASLPEKCRMVFKMIKEDKMTYKQVAEITGLSIKTLEMHMSHALKRLRISVQKYRSYHQSTGVK